MIREINDGYKIKKAEDVARYIDEFMYEDKEFMIILGLDSKNKVLYRDVVSVGTLNSCLIHPREVFKSAVMKSANSIIVVHNHPSGIVEPSEDDVSGMNALFKAGDVLGISLLDVIIIGAGNIESFKDRLKYF